MKVLRQRKNPPGIDMSPLIDCVFQLLIFFLLSSSFLTPMIQLTLPKSKVSDEAQRDQIVVSVDEAGAIYVNTRKVALEDLPAELRPLLERTREKVITFRGDEKATFIWFVKVLEAARSAGAVNVNIAHQGNR